jgi:hypothetical protein
VMVWGQASEKTPIRIRGLMRCGIANTNTNSLGKFEKQEPTSPSELIILVIYVAVFTITFRLGFLHLYSNSYPTSMTGRPLIPCFLAPLLSIQHSNDFYAQSHQGHRGCAFVSTRQEKYCVGLNVQYIASITSLLPISVIQCLLARSYSNAPSS